MCLRCGLIQPLENYYKNRALADGRTIYCRDCQKMAAACKREGAEVPETLVQREKRLNAGKKACATCREWKIFADFTMDSHSSDGMSSNCRSCSRAKAKEKYERKTPLPVLDHDGLRVCRDCGGSFKQDGRLICEPCKAKRKVASLGREYLREKARSRYAADPVKQIARNHARPSGLTSRAKSIVSSSDGSLTVDALTALFADAKVCPYCGVGISGKGKTLDHVVAVANGGKHSIENVLICCRKCNSAKGKLPISAWIGRVAERFGASQAALASEAIWGALGRLGQVNAA